MVGVGGRGEGEERGEEIKNHCPNRNNSTSSEVCELNRSREF